MDSQFCWEYSWNSFNFSVIYSVSSLATGCDESAGGLKKTTAVRFDLCHEWKLEISVKIEINMPNGEQLSLMLLVKCNRAGALFHFLSPASLASSACSFVFANLRGEKVVFEVQMSQFYTGTWKQLTFVDLCEVGPVKLVSNLICSYRAIRSHV